MLRVAVRSVARSALKPSPSVAARSLSTTAARLSDHTAPTPPLYGPGGKPGEIPSDLDQATGLRRAQVLAEREGVKLFDEEPLDSSRIGTLADPIKVLSYEHNRIIGCTGSPAESHELLWMNLTEDKKRRCPECGSVYELDYQGASEFTLHDIAPQAQ
ncbi:COX5B, subunit VB of cytochrome c oxidase [Daedalea quercina L-15889]|uniref:COX5B, subunit VB of cytochrome c oxidase n=1 Tax=Daedalea quercina L-15889 TaxID=1314783 RepID=A0A165TNA8_9APHY|nr:COX5B, subunit VB of cytochrome c oxidase [Daedalea quercina L-15889]